MSLRDLFDMAWRNLVKRKMRTLLTILGVVIGTMSIVVMISIGFGMNKNFEEQLSAWGSLQVISVYSQNGGMYGGMMMYPEEESSQSTTQEEVLLNEQAVETFRNLPYVEVVSPIKYLYLKGGSGRYVADIQLTGVLPEAMEPLGYTVESGRAFTEEDKKSIILGGAVEFYDPKLSWEMRWSTPSPEIELLDSKVDISYDWAYGTQDQDKSVKVEKYEVVGIMSADGQNSWGALMPLEEVERLDAEQKKWQEEANGGSGSFSSSSQQQTKKEYEEVSVKVNDLNRVQEVQEIIKEMGYRATSLTDQLTYMQEQTLMIRVGLGAIGGISLLVAAIGITNTMVMAIYERTREIGVMKVIGASLWDIKRLFLVEAAFIGFGGGILGSVFSFLISKGINHLAMQQGIGTASYIPLYLYAGAIAFATAIGILSGYLPAQRAMKLSALSAIRTE